MGSTVNHAELRRDQAKAAAEIIGRRYRHRRTGHVRQVTDVVRIHRRGAKVVEETDSGPIYQGEQIKIVLDGTLYLSPRAFIDGWLQPAQQAKEKAGDG